MAGTGPIPGGSGPFPSGFKPTPSSGTSVSGSSGDDPGPSAGSPLSSDGVGGNIKLSKPDDPSKDPQAPPGFTPSGPQPGDIGF